MPLSDIMWELLRVQMRKQTLYDEVRQILEQENTIVIYTFEAIMLRQAIRK